MSRDYELNKLIAEYEVELIDDDSYDGVDELMLLDGVAKIKYIQKQNYNTAEVQRLPEADESKIKSKRKRKFEKKSVWAGLIPIKGDRTGEVVRKVIFLVSAAVFITAGVLLGSTLLQSRWALRDQAEIESFFESLNREAVYDDEGNLISAELTEAEAVELNQIIMDYFHGINSDVAAFIELPGCNIRYPVVKGTDNSYYLTRTYKKENNKAGALFMDYRCVVSDDYTSPNIVIYGHNQEDGTMFGNLKFYKAQNDGNIDFYINNPVINLRTYGGEETYLIYGFFVTNTLEKHDSRGEVFYYHDYIESIHDEEMFDWYLNEIQRRNQVISPVDVKYGDSLMLLSTCSNEFSNSRFVVFARKLREGERADDYDFTTSKYNYNRKGLDWNAITSDWTTLETETETEISEETEETTSKTKKTSVPESEEEPEESESSARFTAPDALATTNAATIAITTVPTESETEEETESSSRRTKKTTAPPDEETESEVTSKKKTTTAPPEEDETESETTSRKKTTTTTEAPPESESEPEE